jgi:hypothetical protein
MDTFTSIDSNSNSIVSPPLSPSIPPAHHEKNDTDNQSTTSVIDKLNPKSSTGARHELNLSSKLATLKSLQKQIALDHEALEGIRSRHSQGSTGKDGTKVYGAEEKEFNNSTAESIKGIMAKVRSFYQCHLYHTDAVSELVRVAGGTLNYPQIPPFSPYSRAFPLAYDEGQRRRISRAHLINPRLLSARLWLS